MAHDCVRYRPQTENKNASTSACSEFFEQNFHGRSFTNSLNYYPSTWLFNSFPIPQREPGTLETLRYMGKLANENGAY
jgi:hypothetical protein